MSEYKNDDIIFDDLERPSTTKGSILAHNGASDFEVVAPSADCQTLVADSSQSSGIVWLSSTVNSGFSYSAPDIQVIVDVGGSNQTGYFMVNFSAGGPTVPLALPKCSAIYLSIQINENGWASDPTLITGGSIAYTVGYVPANTSASSVNFIAYSGGPHLTINFTDINTNPNRYRSFATTLNLDVASGDLVSVRAFNTLSRAGGPAPTFGQYTSFLFFRGVL